MRYSASCLQIENRGAGQSLDQGNVRKKDDGCAAGGHGTDWAGHRFPEAVERYAMKEFREQAWPLLQR